MEKILEEIGQLKSKLKDKVVILGHHYQSDEIIKFADITGDSLILAQKAAKVDKPYIVFCGVHFMAETADILTSSKQKVILPDLEAGCPMADMAKLEDVEEAFELIKQNSKQENIIPITYVNSSAKIKAFVGRNNGFVCTSSNARKIMEAAQRIGERLFFFPDQHLGRNTSYQMGLPLSDMAIYDPSLQNGGLSREQLGNSKIILWYGYCSVHQEFTIEQIKNVRMAFEDRAVIVHPECSFDVVQKADLVGSTSYIAKTVQEAASKSKFAIGTEINLVNRLARQYPDKDIKSLSPYQCMCSTMYRIRPAGLLESLKSIDENRPINVIKVPTEIKKDSLLAINRMLELS